MTSVRWSLWGTYAFLAVRSPGLLEPARVLAVDLLDEVEQACSRFRDDSDLSRANRRPGRWSSCGPVLADAVRAGLAAAEASDGLVDPCLGRALVSLGYDRDLALLRARPALPFQPVGPAPVRPGAWHEVEVRDDAVRVPEGVGLDLGATAKAWAADVVAETLAERLGSTVVVSLGGDVRVAGPGRPRWTVRITEHPGAAPDADDDAEVVLRGGLATSTTVVRRWGGAPGAPAASQPRHHLLDPRTGMPTSGAYRTVTAAGATCLAANTASTAALVLGSAAPAWLARHRVAARLVAQDSRVSTVGAWPYENQHETHEECA
jgi:thiamine biosynthesis lipoprotein